MQEEIFTGDDMAFIVTEAEGIKDYNSIRFWVNGEEVEGSDIVMVIYNDPNQS